MRLIDADEFEKRISEYNTTDITDSILYNFAHSKLISMPTVEDKPQGEEKNICDSCMNTACIFDSHVKRQKCDFYKTQTEWIPVSEPPKKDGKYLVTLRFITHDEVATAKYSNNLHKVDALDFPENKAGWYNYDSEYGYYEQDSIIAWMPLPTPYEPQGSEVRDETDN